MKTPVLQSEQKNGLNIWCRFLASDQKKQTLILLLLITLAGLLLRLYGLNERSLWVDEMFTIAHALGNQINLTALDYLGQAMDPETPQALSYYHDFLLQSHGLGNWQATVEVLKLNNHPPFFFWLMNWVIHLLGDSPAMLRLPAFLCGVACIPMMFLLGRKIHSVPLGLMAALFMSLSGYQVLHAQDARPYTMVTLLAISQSWLFFRLIQRPKEQVDSEQHENTVQPAVWLHWLGFTLLGTLGLYTHYFYGPFLIGLLLYGSIRKFRDIQFITALISSYLLIALAFSPWLEILNLQKDWVSHSGHFTGGRWDWIQVPEYIWRMLNEFVSPKNLLMKLLATFLLIYGLWIHYHRKPNRFAISPLVLFAFCWLVCIYGFQILIDVLSDSSTLNVRRYTLLAAPAYYLLLGGAIINIREDWIRPAIIAGVALIMGVNTGQIVTRSIPFAQHFSAVAQWINKNPMLTPDDTVLVNPSGPHTVAMAYYLKRQSTHVRLLGLPVNSMFSEADYRTLNRRLDNASTTSENLWVVLSQSSDSAKLAIDQRLTHQHFIPSASVEFPKSLKVILYTRTKHSLPKKG